MAHRLVYSARDGSHPGRMAFKQVEGNTPTFFESRCQTRLPVFWNRLMGLELGRVFRYNLSGVS